MATKAQCAWNKIALLGVLDATRRVNPAPVTNVVIQKHLFLTELAGRKAGIKTAYFRFFRYKHGPFSNELSWTIAQFEKCGLIDSEDGELLDKGRALLNYVDSEINSSWAATEAMAIIEGTANEWKAYRGWAIVEPVYELTVPVDQLAGETMKVRDIPQKVDILIPESTKDQDVEPFDDQITEDVYSFLSHPAVDLDSPEGWEASLASLDAAFAL